MGAALALAAALSCEGGGAGSAPKGAPDLLGPGVGAGPIGAEDGGGEDGAGGAGDGGEGCVPERCDDPAHADEDCDGLANCEDAECAATCVEACDGADGDQDGLTDCLDPDCTYTEACVAGLRVTAEGLSYRLVRWEKPAETTSESARYTSVLRGMDLHADTLRIEAPVAASGSAPCWIELTDLEVAGRLEGVSPSRLTSWREFHAEAGGLLYGGDGCPGLRLDQLAAALPRRIGTASSALELRVGDRVPVAALRLSRGPDLQLALQVTAAGPYTRGMVVGPWAGISQTARGTLSIGVAP